VDLWDAQTLGRVRPGGVDPVGGYGATEARFSPDGKQLAIASGMGAVRVWSMDPGAGTETLRGHTNVVVATAAVRQANQILLVSTGNDGLINMWTRPLDGSRGAGGWTARTPIKTPYTNRAMSLSDDGTLVAASGFDGSVNIWETATGSEVAHLLGHRAMTAALAFTHDGTRLISGSADQTLRIWHLDPGDRQWKLDRLIENQPGETLGISVSRDDRIAVTSHRGAVARFWSLPDANLIAVRPTASAVWLPAFAPHGDRLAVGCWDRAAELWDLAPLRPRAAAPTTVPSIDVAPRQAAYLGHTQLVTGVAVSEDGALLASASQDGLVRIFDATAGVQRPTDEPQQNLVTLDAHGGEAFQVVFLPPPLEHLVAAGYQDGAVRVFDLSYFDRHIAGQVEYQIALHDPELGDRIRRDALRRGTVPTKSHE
jgi:WD40 repeat protein